MHGSGRYGLSRLKAGSWRPSSSARSPIESQSSWRASPASSSTDLQGSGFGTSLLDAFALQPPRLGMPAFMRYGDGGGVNQAGRARREQIRDRAAAMFAEGMPAP